MDPIAVYAAALSTLLGAFKAWEFLTDRPNLRVTAEPAWPEFRFNRGDLGGDPGPMYVRLNVANLGRRAAAVHEVGLALLSADRSDTVPSGLGYVGTIRFTDKPLSVPPAAVLPFDRKAEEVDWLLRDSVVPGVYIAGAYVRFADGSEKQWPAPDIADIGTDASSFPWLRDEEPL